MSKLAAAGGWEGDSDVVVRAERIFAFEEAGDLPIFARQFSSQDAHELQMRLLPTRPPLVEGYRFAGVSVPAALVGGDHFNFLSCGGDSIGLLLFDVSGKGAMAALVAARLRSIFRTQTWGNHDARDVVARANDFLLRVVPTANFVTAIYGILELKKRRFHFVRAGHEPLLLRRASGEIETLAPAGFPLGLLPSREFSAALEIQTLQLESGDRLLLFSDGLTETMNPCGEEFGPERIAQTLAASGGDDLHELQAAVIEFAQGAPQHDDLTLLSAEVE